MNIQENRHYIVTHWVTEKPLHTMRVWTDTVTDTMVKGHVSSKGYPLVDTCVWTRHLASAWTWTEIEK
jgi:hypothetical protein